MPMNRSSSSHVSYLFFINTPEDDDDDAIAAAAVPPHVDTDAPHSLALLVA